MSDVIDDEPVVTEAEWEQWRQETQPARLSGAELIEEVEWLLSFGMHPLLICRTLNTTVDAVSKKLRYHGRNDLSRSFYPFSQQNERAHARAFRAAA